VKVLRIVPDFSAREPQEIAAFYRDLLDLDIAMDMGWIITLQSDATTQPQLTIGNQGGSDQPMPSISVEVDDVDEVYRRAKAGTHPIIYDLVDEPWAVRRFFLLDPAGRTINILQHIE
jgi:predicted enzyme related to lactoylglutathione lyase